MIAAEVPVYGSTLHNGSELCECTSPRLQISLRYLNLEQNSPAPYHYDLCISPRYYLWSDSDRPRQCKPGNSKSDSLQPRTTSYSVVFGDRL
jgi:hypothetical protein